jgi:flagellar basal body P-ring protein FlgI
MRRTDPSRARAATALAAITALAVTLAGAGPLKKKRAEPPPPKAEETIGDLADIFRGAETKLEGVGLVVGLDDTGVDPPPSWYRQKLVDDMRKAGVEKPNEWLKNPKVAMVIVKMTVPPGVGPTDRLDVEVEVPPAGGTKSLAGGYLVQCRLREVMVLGGSPKEGSEAAVAQGPVMTGSAARPNDPKVGRVLGGGHVRKETPHQLILKESRRSFKSASLVERVVNQRFPQSDGVEQKGSATARTDQYIVLKVPRIYHQNQDRFFRVVRLLSVVDSPGYRVERMAAWGRQLLDPKTAGVAALRLEGLGATAADALKAGLESPNPTVRFLAAEAMAYLNDASGAEVLADTARDQPQFRAQALAALAAMDQPAAHMKLRKLMDQPDVEVRYGAFNALRVLAGDDPFLGQVRVLDDPGDDAPEEAPADSMAAALGTARRRPRPEDPFALYIVDCDGPPMVHVSRSRRCEVVLFGRGMRLLPPVVLGSGPLLLNAADGDVAVEISKIVPSQFSDTDRKVTSSLELADVIRQVANLGANYPEVVAILQAAQKQQNLPGPLVVDAVPAVRPGYLDAAILGKETTAKTDAKKDPAVKPTKLDAPADAKPQPRRGLLNRLRERFSGR